MGEDRLDDLARALATPMPRRRALRVLAAGLAAAAAPGITARWARAAAPSAPCSQGGTFCGYPDGGGYNIGCCLGANGDTRTVCCPGQHAVYGSCCCPTGYSCTFPGSTDPDCCTCKSGVTCGDKCCRAGEYCETRFLGEDTCEKLCPHTHKPKCIGVCCTDDETCGVFGCSCKSGLVSTGAGTCVPPKDDPGNPKPANNPISNMLNMMGQSSGAHGGGGHRSVLAQLAQSGSAAVDAALDALAAVNGQGAAAMLAIGQGKRDSAFRQKVTVARATPPTLSAGPGLDAGSVAALNRLLVAEARANALIAAMAKALWRARAAHAKHNHAAAKRQLLASAGFAGQAVTALKPVQALRTAAADAMTAGKVSEVLAFDGAVTAFIATVQSTGIPPYLRTPMGKLGVTSTDLKRLRTGVLDLTVTAAAGPVLIAPLRSPTRATSLTGLISELSKFATRARKHPIAH